MNEEQKQTVRDAVASALGNAYDCQRVWSAWGVGTMSSNDFSLVAEDDERLDDITDAALAAMPAPFQARVQPWMLECFGVEIAADAQERNHRFLEEALELVQACGATASEAHQLVDYVYGRPVGDKAQEVGGVMVTLAALCLAQGLDMHAAGETELARIWTKVEQIRAKQAAKPKHSPLPQFAPNEGGSVFQIIDNAIASAEEYDPVTSGGDLRIVTLRMDQAKKVRDALGGQRSSKGDDQVWLANSKGVNEGGSEQNEEILRLHREMAGLRQMLEAETRRADSAVAVSNATQDQLAAKNKGGSGEVVASERAADLEAYGIAQDIAKQMGYDTLSAALFDLRKRRAAPQPSESPAALADVKYTQADMERLGLAVADARERRIRGALTDDASQAGKGDSQ
ncbi:hypothetical protein [Cupriavidus sp. UME77]|uniref:hypothetical protein n=1 Tax=Cupriavidus sp. UME77 TaxID=1862321 RepID=UPI002103D024|nr:hypothetical protein [Cupriavidus sp. UME77]